MCDSILRSPLRRRSRRNAVDCISNSIRVSRSECRNRGKEWTIAGDGQRLALITRASVAASAVASERARDARGLASVSRPAKIEERLVIRPRHATRRTKVNRTRLTRIFRRARRPCGARAAFLMELVATGANVERETGIPNRGNRVRSFVALRLGFTVKVQPNRRFPRGFDGVENKRGSKGVRVIWASRESR